MESLTTSSVELWLRLLAAALCGGAVGWEREIKNRPAGLRTHMLVALGAAGFTMLSTELLERHPSSDPARIIEGIIGGVGFLGAGTILQRRGDIKGMTTAAGIWVVAAIGIAAGLGEYQLLIALVLITLVTLFALPRMIGKPRPPTPD